MDPTPLYHMTQVPLGLHYTLTLRYVLVPVDCGIFSSRNVPGVIGIRKVLRTQVGMGERGDHVGRNWRLEEDNCKNHGRQS